MMHSLAKFSKMSIETMCARVKIEQKSIIIEQELIINERNNLNKCFKIGYV